MKEDVDGKKLAYKGSNSWQSDIMKCMSSILGQTYTKMKDHCTQLIDQVSRSGIYMTVKCQMQLD